MGIFSGLGFQNLDLLSVGVSMAAIGLLGFLTFFNDRSKPVSKVFLGMCLTAISWSLFNYLSYQFNDPNVVIWLLRFAIFFAVWFSYSIFLLFYYFPTESFRFAPVHKKIIIPLTLLVSGLNFTPLVFKSVADFSADGRVSKVINGPGIIVFGLMIVFLIGCGAYLLVKKRRISQNSTEKQQIAVILTGIIITCSLLIIFNYVFPALLNQATFVPLGGVLLFPFIACTAYAIFRLRLFNVKIIATEVLVFFLSLGLLIDVMLATTTFATIIRFAIFVLLLIVGVLLINSVIREVKQRELLEDITQQLEDANEKLKTLDQARAEFITIASHQLRTPPATIKWFLASVLGGDYGPLPDELRPILEKADRTNNSQISLIDDMLNVSRIERGKMEFLFEPGDMLELANITFEQLEPIAKEKGLNLTFNRPKIKPPLIMVDKEKIRQVMNNLIDNALKYTKTGSIWVELSSTPEEVKFSVKDTGKGVTPEEQGEIFQKFSRGKESIKQSAGLGLGLYVAKIVVEQHKGKIWTESAGAGLGSTFAFTLPIHSGLTKTTIMDFAVK